MRTFRNAETKESDTSKLREVDDPSGRANWFMYQRMFPFDKIPEGARRAAFDEVVVSRGGIWTFGTGKYLESGWSDAYRRSRSGRRCLRSDQ